MRTGRFHKIVTTADGRVFDSGRSYSTRESEQRNASGALPTIDPADVSPVPRTATDIQFIELFGRYKDEIERGRADVIGDRTIGDRSIIWLQFPSSGPAQPLLERVAVDLTTYQPVAVRFALSADGPSLGADAGGLPTPWPDASLKPCTLAVNKAEYLDADPTS